MDKTLPWQDALMRLHVAGWDTDDIDSACDVLVEAHENGQGAGDSLRDYTPSEVRGMLDVEIAPADIPALLALAELRSSQGADAQALQEALFDLDAFAYAYAGDD